MISTLDIQPDLAPASLRESFVRSLAKRLDDVKTHWDAVLDSGGDRADMTNFVGAIHYFAGGAGVYGYVSMSRLAYRILAHIQPCIDNKVAFTSEIRSTVDRLLIALCQQKIHFETGGPDITSAIYEKPDVVIEEEGWSELSNEVYILEQSPDEELALRVFLENSGFHAHAFKSLHKLQKAIGDAQPRAIILDLQQCNQDATAASYITNMQRQSARNPVFALSDTGDVKARLQAVKLGATHFFLKPVDGYRLVDVLHKMTNIGGASRVLVVDDDPQTAQYVAVHLRMEGLDVQIINDPYQILDAMSRFNPDLILTDLYMPGCNGLDMATLIRQHEVYFDVPIVFLSSENEEQTRLTALQLGSDDFFTKSIDIDVVAKAIKSRLDRMAGYAQVKKAMMWSPN